MTYVALIQESMPDYYLGMRKRSRAAFLALFMWVGLGCLLAHSYRFFNNIIEFKGNHMTNDIISIRSTLLANLVAVEQEKPIDTFQDILDNGVLLVFPKGDSSFNFPVSFSGLCYYSLIQPYSGTMITPTLKNSASPSIRKVCTGNRNNI